MSARTEALIQHLRAIQPDASEDTFEYVMTDDLGEHWVMWIEPTNKDGGPAGIWFYVDEINARVVVEGIGPSRT